MEQQLNSNEVPSRLNAKYLVLLICYVGVQENQSSTCTQVGMIVLQGGNEFATLRARTQDSGMVSNS
jgi:hypothetical protein